MVVERTRAGLQRAKAEGVKLGRPAKTNDQQRIAIRERLTRGDTVSAIAREFQLSRASVIAIRG